MDVLRVVTEQALERKPVKFERNITKAEKLQIRWGRVDLKHFNGA
jgi:hypothetical protein